MANDLYNFDPTSFNTRMQPYSDYDALKGMYVSTGGNNPVTTELTPVAQAVMNNPYQLDWGTLINNLQNAINSYFSRYDTQLQSVIQSFPSAPQMNFNINKEAIVNAQGGLGGFGSVEEYLKSTPSYRNQQNILNQYNQAQQQFNQNIQQSQGDINQMKQYYQNIEQQYQNMNPTQVSEMIGMGELNPFLTSFGGTNTYQGIGVKMPKSIEDLTVNEIRDLQAASGSGSHMGPQIESAIRSEENSFLNITNSMNSFINNTKSLFSNLGLSSDEITKYMQPITNAFSAYHNLYVNELGTPTNPNWIPNPQDPFNNNNTVTGWGYEGGGS